MLGIFVGHIHASYTYKWNRHNVYCTGGDSWALVDLVTDASGITSCQVAFATAADGSQRLASPERRVCTLETCVKNDV